MAGKRCPSLPKMEVTDIPLAFGERQAVLRELATRYTKASKAEKRNLLNEATKLLGYNRSYTARTLRQRSRRRPTINRNPSPRPGRPRVYGPHVRRELIHIWAVMNFPSGKRLAPFMEDLVIALERHGELCLSADTRRQLIAMSASTIDRLLASERKRLEIKGRSGTRPGSLLKQSIPIRTFADWDDARPGFLEVDLVSHEGGNASGDFCQTLDMTDIATCWTETVAVRNKAQRWVFEALTGTFPAFPFPILGIDSDNGSEFINSHLVAYCQKHQLTFTRSRPERKNDNCFVEQKNWAVVRRTVGYHRYDTPEHLDLLNQLYAVLRLYTNFFQPTQKLIRKERHGAKAIRVYDTAKTPYQRVLASEHVAPASKEQLTALYLTLNPAKLRRDLNSLQLALIGVSAKPKDLVAAASDTPV